MPERDGKPRLGRGLASLFGEEVQATPASMISIGRIRPGPFQPRAAMAAETLQELEASIRTHGILQPILIRPDPAAAGLYQIVAGERRWRAAQSAGLAEVPVIARDLSDNDAMAAGLIENLQRRDLNALEEAEGYRRLTEEFGLNHEKVAATVGKSRSHVANCLRLLSLPEPVKAHVRSGVLSAGHARAALGHGDPEWAARAMIARDLNVREAERLANSSSTRKPRTRRAAEHGEDADTAAVAQRLTERLGLVVRLDPAGRGGVLRIEYADLDQLDGLMRLLAPD